MQGFLKFWNLFSASNGFKIDIELLNLLKFIYQSNGAKWKNLVVAKTDVKAKKELAV